MLRGGDRICRREEGGVGWELSGGELVLLGGER